MNNDQYETDAEFFTVLEKHLDVKERFPSLYSGKATDGKGALQMNVAWGYVLGRLTEKELNGEHHNAAWFARQIELLNANCDLDSEAEEEQWAAS